MSEFQKIAIGLLGTTHPEIAWMKQRAEKAQPPGNPLKSQGGAGGA